MTNSALFLVVVIVAVGLVIAALVIAKLLAPSSSYQLKGDPYECGIPTRGDTWVQFKVGYYLFAIMFLMFDIEIVLLLPWAVVVKSIGVEAIFSMSLFLAILALGLAYAWKKGALEWK